MTVHEFNTDMIEELILKFRKNECTMQERMTVLQYFKQHPEMLNEYMTEQDWQQFMIDKDFSNDPLFKSIYSNIEKKISIKKKKPFMYVKTVAGIAATALLTITIYVVFKEKIAIHNKATAALVNKKIFNSADTTVNNISNVAQTLHLSDSSMIKLLPGSSLRYPKVFKENKRDLTLLAGKAFFYVAKDKSKPFTVFAGNTATTALGTVFTVEKNKKSNRVDVHLYKGKVVVKSYEDSATGKILAYLNPGNEFNNVVQEKKKTVIPTSVSENKVTKEKSDVHIVFNNVSLQNVFDSIQTKTNVKFYYKKKLIENIFYTGIYDSKRQSLYNFLNTIALLNGLSILTKDSTIYNIHELK